jgi:SAM-dependent methyltransferase
MHPTENLDTALKVSSERLYPSLTDPNWLILRERRKIFSRWLQQFPVAAPLVLDVGGRLQPYRPLVRNCARYVALDLRVTPLVDLVGRAEQLPFPNDFFDLAICTQVLEYVPVPQLAVGELHRVLKPGGWLLLSAPSVFPRDSDHEYWRFLPAALRALHASFSQVEIAAEGNSLTGLIRTVNTCLVAFAKPQVFKELLRLTVVPSLNGIAAFLAWGWSSRNDTFSANFSVLARK